MKRQGSNPTARTKLISIYVKRTAGNVRFLIGCGRLPLLDENAPASFDFEMIERWFDQFLAALIERNTAIPCTACAYCTHDCPKHIAIPQYFALYNNVMRITGDFSSQQVYYNNTALANGKASECIKCRRCERACPQHLPITQHLEAVAEKFEKNARPLPTKK